MQVTRPEHQHQVMIEAVENHMPEVIVIDEIGTELETHAARTIAERGVQLVATAHGNALANLIKNPTLSDLVGGIQSVTLGDEEARRRRTQKTVLERAAEPTFPIAVEMNSHSRWSIHTNVASTVDLLLRGQSPRPQERALNHDGSLQLLNSPAIKHPLNRPALTPIGLSGTQAQASDKQTLPNQNAEDTFIHEAPDEKTLHVLCCGINNHLVDEAIRRHSWPARWVNSLNEADVVLSIRQGLSHEPALRREARESQVPILVIKSDTLSQVERALQRLLARRQVELDQKLTSDPQVPNKDDSLAALEECRLALEKVVVPLGRPVELLPRSERILQMQVDLVTRYRLRSDVFGHANQKRLRVYPP